LGSSVAFTLNVSIRLVESSASYAVNDKLKLAGSVVLKPSEISLPALKATSALGAQYTTPNYVLSAVTEGAGAINKATLSTKVGSKDVALAATLDGAGNKLALMTGFRTEFDNGVALKAGIATSGDVDVELSKKVYHHIGVRLGAKTNLNSPTKPKFGAQISLEAKP